MTFSLFDQILRGRDGEVSERFSTRGWDLSEDLLNVNPERPVTKFI